VAARSRLPDEERTVIDCISVVMDEEIEHYRFALPDRDAWHDPAGCHAPNMPDIRSAMTRGRRLPRAPISE